MTVASALKVRSKMRNTACEFNTGADHLAECFLTVYCIWDPTAEQTSASGSAELTVEAAVEQDQQVGSADAELNPLAVSPFKVTNEGSHRD